MSETEQLGNRNRNSQRQSLVGALPPLLVGLGIALMWLIIGGPWYTAPSWRLILAVVVGLVPFAVLGGGGLIALVRRLPDWGYTWVGGALMGLMLMVQSRNQ